jgi:hypothetical protein
MPDNKKYSRVEEEVMEILDRLEDERPAPGRRPSHLRLVSSRPAKPRRRFTIPKLPSLRLSALPLWWTLAASFGLAMIALFVRDTSQTLGMVLVILAVLLFLSPFVFRRGGSSIPGGSGPSIGGSVTKEWRGRDITLGPTPGPSAGERAKRWLDDRRGRPR